MAAQVIPYNPTLDKVVLVNSIADLPEPILVGSDYIITLAQDTTYQFAPGVIDLGANQLVCSSANKLIGQGSKSTELTSSLASGTWLKSLGPNGVCVIEGLTITLSDPAITAFEFDSLELLSFKDMTVVVQGALGSMTDIDAMYCTDSCSFSNFTSGWQIAGTNGDFLFDNCIILNNNVTPATDCVNVDIGTTFNGVFHVIGCTVFNAAPNNVFKVPNTTVFSLGNQAYKIIGCDFRGGGKTVLGISHLSPKLTVKASYGIFNTFDGIEYYFTGAPITTTINTVTVAEKIAGTTALGLVGRNFSTPSDNNGTYDGDSTKRFNVQANVFIEGLLAPFVATVYIAKVGVLNTNLKVTVTVPTTGMFVSLSSIEELEPTNYIELYIANETSNDDITVSSGNVHIIELG